MGQGSELSREQREEDLRLAEEHDRRKRFSMRDYFAPSKAQIEFCNSTSKYTMFSGSNQTSGKSTILKYVASVHLDGKYPRDKSGNLVWRGHRFDHPVTIMLGSLESKQTRNNLIVGDANKPGIIGPEDARGTGMLPLSSFDTDHPTLRIYRAAGSNHDVIDYFQVKWHKWNERKKQYEWDGKSYSRCNVFSEATGWENMQGGTIDWIGLDEEFKDDSVAELKARLISSDGGEGGRMAISLCPLHGWTELFGTFDREMQEDPEFSRIVFAEIDDSFWLSEKAIENAKRTYRGRFDYDARIRGRPGAGQGAIYPISDDEIVVPDDTVPLDCKEIIGIDLPHTTGTFAAVKILHHERTDTVYLTKEFKSAQGVNGRATYTEALRMMGGEKTPIAWPHDGGRLGAGESLAEYYRDVGLYMLPEYAHILTMDGKKSNQVIPVMDEVNSRMHTGRFKVVKSCVKFLQEKQRYGADKDGMPKKKQDDHLIDAMHKAVMMLRFAEAPSHESFFADTEISGEYNFFGAH